MSVSAAHSLQRRLAGNTLVQFAPPILAVVVGIPLSAILSRHLGLAGFGAYAFVTSYVAAFGGVLNDWGLNAICLREISQRPALRSTLVMSAAALQFWISAITYLALVTALLFMHRPGSISLAAVLFGVTLFTAALDLLTLPFQADLQLHRTLGPILSGMVLRFGLVVAALVAGGGLVAVIVATLVALLVQYGWLMALAAPNLRGALRPLRGHWLMYVREAGPLGVATIFTTVMQQAPLLVVSAASLEAAGLFSAAARIPLQLTMLPLIVRASTFPLLSSFWVSDRARYARLLTLLINGSVIVVVPMVLLVAGLNRVVIGVIFGSAYLGATTPFVLLMVMVGLMTPCILVGEAMIAAGFQRVNLVITLLASLLLVGLLIVLVPRDGATGASAALVVCWCFIAVTTFTVARRRLGVAVPLGAPLAAVAAAAVGVLVALVASRTGEIPSALLSAAAGAAVLCALRPTATGQLVAVVQRMVRRPR